MEQLGRLTLPTDADVVEETLRLKNLLGADALRDCDGTEMPQELLTDPAKKYATYYTTRKDNAWAEANPDEVQQEYLISDRHTARGTKLRIHLMDGFHTQQLKVNTLDDPKRWWEVIDRTTGARGIKCVTRTEPFFQGHFPGRPIMPGVLILEALAQTGAVAALSLPENQGKLALFGGVKNARFRRQVVPGDVLTLECELVEQHGPIGIGKATAWVGNERAANAELTFVIADA